MDGGNAALSTEQSGLSLIYTCSVHFGLTFERQRAASSLNLRLGFNRRSCTY